MAEKTAIPEMQLAEILSDLVSLRPGVCVSYSRWRVAFKKIVLRIRQRPCTNARTQDPVAALALVSARPASSSISAPSTGASSTEPDDAATDNSDEDLRRAKELVELHYDVRERCKRGELSSGLAEARSAVERALG